jgi:hypothetical protein
MAKTFTVARFRAATVFVCPSLCAKGDGSLPTSPSCRRFWERREPSRPRAYNQYPLPLERFGGYPAVQSAIQLAIKASLSLALSAGRT